MIKISRKFEKKTKFNQRIAKAGVIEILITIPLTAYHQALEEVSRTLVPEKKKNQRFKNLKKLETF